MPENSHSDFEQIESLIDAGRDEEVRPLLRDMDPADVADLLEDLGDDQRDQVFMLLDPASAADVLPELEEGYAEHVVEEISPGQLAEIAAEMAPDESADFLSDLDDSRTAEVLAAMPARDREALRDLLQYEEESAGGIMTPEFCALSANTTVAEARQALARAELSDPIYYIHVLRRNGRLIGLVNLMQLVTSPPDARLKDLADPDFQFARVDEDQEQIAAKFRKYDLLAMPVIDDQQRLIGRITVDDIMDVLHEEASEDIALMAGVSDLTSEEFSSWDSARKRLPWLLITLATGLVNSVIIKSMLNVTNIEAIAVFVPAILAMGGNTGIQSSTLCIRAITLGRRASRVVAMVGREMLVGVLLGATCGTLTGFLAWALLHYGGAETGLEPARLATVVGIAMANAMIFATGFGTITPIILDRLKVDPAVATGPFVTTSNDLSASLIYFATCVLILKPVVG